MDRREFLMPHTQLFNKLLLHSLILSWKMQLVLQIPSKVLLQFDALACALFFLVKILEDIVESTSFIQAVKETRKPYLAPFFKFR